MSKLGVGEIERLSALGMELFNQDKFLEAEGCYRKIISSYPFIAEAHVLLGNTLIKQDKFAEAVKAIEKGLKLNPLQAEAQMNLGNLYQHVDGEPLKRSVDCYKRAIEIKPSLAPAHYNLADVYKKQKKYSEAIDLYIKTLELQPDFALAHNALGVIYKIQGRLKRAEDCYLKAIGLREQFAAAHNNLGNVYQLRGAHVKAIYHFKKAIKYNPGYIIAYNNLGVCLGKQGRDKEAVKYYKKALAAKPDASIFLNNLGIVYQNLGENKKAIKYFRRSVKSDPNDANSTAHLAHQLQIACEWKESAEMAKRVDDFTSKAIKDGKRVWEAPFMNITRCDDLERNHVMAKAWSKRIAESVSGTVPQFKYINGKRKGKKITVGYISDGFRNFPTGQKIVNMFDKHDRRKFNINVYSYGPDDKSYYRKKIKRDADKFVDIIKHNHVAAAKAINKDGVDILVDLKGCTRNVRMEIMALRPAPVQMTYLGFPGTTGASFIDYLIADKTIIPVGDQKHFSERIIYLPDTYQVNDDKQKIERKSYKRSDFGLPNEGYVFSSFNDPYKIDEKTFDLWMDILKIVPKSVLWQLERFPEAKGNLIKAAKKRGVDPRRIVFADILPKDKHLARIKLSDLALDTLIVNGHSTTSDCLWAGVPVIAVYGKHFASRVSASLLNSVGLGKLVADTTAKYKNLAVRLANDDDLLSKYRTILDKNRLESPLFDTTGFVRNLEQGFIAAWERYQNNMSPRKIVVKKAKR